MKKFFTLAATALIAFTANAELNFTDQLTPFKLSDLNKIPAKMKKAPAQKQDTDAALESFLGDFVHSQWALDPDTYTDWIASNCGMNISDNGDGTVTMTNFLGFGDIVATYDAEEEALLAAPGQFLFASKYGSVCLFPFTINDDSEAVIDTEGDLMFYLDDENRFELLNDGVIMVLTDGDYAGYSINYLYMFNQFDRVNGTMSWINAKGEENKVGVAIDNNIEENSGYVDVYGFADLGCAIITIEGEEAQLYSQGLFFHGDYGLFVNTGFTIEGEEIVLSEDEYSLGTYVDNIISLDQFCVQCEGTYYDFYLNAKINLTLDEPSAISTIKTQQNQKVYDLQGCLTNRLQQGQIYMQNGRKFVVK